MSNFAHPASTLLQGVASDLNQVNAPSVTSLLNGQGSVSLAKIQTGSAGGVLGVNKAGNITWMPPNVVTANPSSLTSINNFAGTRLMGGWGVTITPQRSGVVIMFLSGGQTGRPGTWTLRYGTGTAPSFHAAETGTSLFGTAIPGVPTAAYVDSGVASGLTINTAYWFDMSLGDDGDGGGGTTTISSPHVVLVEIG